MGYNMSCNQKSYRRKQLRKVKLSYHKQKKSVDLGAFGKCYFLKKKEFIDEE